MTITMADMYERVTKGPTCPKQQEHERHFWGRGLVRGQQVHGWGAQPELHAAVGASLITTPCCSQCGIYKVGCR